jgi:hypothetical protein
MKEPSFASWHYAEIPRPEDKGHFDPKADINDPVVRGAIHPILNCARKSAK